MRAIEGVQRVVVALVPILCLLLLWDLLYRTGILPQSQIVSPWAMFQRAFALITELEFLTHLFNSTKRLLVGVLCGTLLGASAGILIACSRPLRRTFSATFTFMAGVPVVVWMPFWIAVSGIGEVFKMGLVGIAAFFLSFSVAMIATRRASRDYLEVAQMLEKSLVSTVAHIYAPAVLTQSFIALRLGLAFGWVILFFVEYAVSEPGSQGLGWYVANARAVGRIEDEFAGMFMLGVIAFGIDRVVGLIQNGMTSWGRTLDD